MEIRYKPTVDEFREANRLLLVSRGGVPKLKYNLYVRWAFVVGPILIALGLALLWQGILRGVDLPVVLGFAVTFGAGVGWLFNPWWYRRKLSRLFRERKGETECVYSADESGISMARADGASDGRANWSVFDKAVESSDIFTLFFSRSQCLYIAKRAMTPEQQDEFRALVAAHIPNAGVQPVAVS